MGILTPQLRALKLTCNECLAQMRSFCPKHLIKNLLKKLKNAIFKNHIRMNGLALSLS